MAAKEAKLEYSLRVPNKQTHVQQRLTRLHHLEDLRGPRRIVCRFQKARLGATHVQQRLTRQHHLEDLRGPRRNVDLRTHAQARGLQAPLPGKHDWRLP